MDRATYDATLDMLGVTDEWVQEMRGDVPSWDFALALKERADDLYEAAVDAFYDTVSKHGDGGSVVLTYYPDQLSYDEREGAHGFPYTFANAVSLRVAAFVEDAGVDVRFAYPGDDPATEMAYAKRKADEAAIK